MCIPSPMKVEGVFYDIDWGTFPKGHSVFIPCLDTQAGKEDIYQEAQRLEVAVFVRGETHRSVKGLRLWRL
jgi:hypothetical protein